ncbi:LAMI_0H13740g1_1 [Lachancea mirantina]|uniref:LAMI_0H13740g1_1 n=1 Tax=Lachancea mirantina TaxID=1230905 RepID=A0A1G4KHU7_9SACH|nr:LAMI_0H13740g1_1 [Lachancea mirantina]
MPPKKPIRTSGGARFLDAIENFLKNPSNNTTSLCKTGIELLNAARDVVLRGEQLEVANNLDIFSPIIFSLPHTEFHLDLIAYLFAYCSVHSGLSKLAQVFAHRATNDPKVIEKLRSLCQGSETSYAPGFYTVIKILDQFPTIDAKIAGFLDMRLSHVLVNAWIPLWDYKASSTEPLAESFISRNVLFASTNDALLEFLIAAESRAVSQWRDLEDIKSKATHYFITVVATRTVEVARFVSAEFLQFASTHLTHCFHNDSVERAKTDVFLNLQVLMEIVDHKDINFCEESHLALLLNVSLQNLYRMCRDGKICAIHSALGKLGSTQSLPALILIAAYVIGKFIVSVGNTVLFAEPIAYGKTVRAVRDLSYGLPPFFEDVLPKHSPIPKSSFTFDKSKSTDQEKPLVSYSKITADLLDILRLLFLITKELLGEYGKLISFELPKRKNASQITSSLELKFQCTFLKLYFISTSVALVVSEQLTDQKSHATMIGEKQALIYSKVLELNSSDCVAAIFETFEGFALYQFVSFSKLVSSTDLLLQRKHIELIENLASKEESVKIVANCLTDELASNSFKKYIQLKNDGSAHFKPIYANLLKMEQPKVETKKIAIRSLELLIKRAYPEAEAREESQNKNSGLTTQKMEVSATNAQKNSFKFNANASSFIPNDSGPALIQRQIPETDSHEFLSQAQRQTLRPPNNNSNYRLPSNRNFATEPSHSNYQHVNYDQKFSKQIDPSNLWNNKQLGDQTQQHRSINSASVNTGKNYILSGFNWASNNSKPKSVHVDMFDNHS